MREWGANGETSSHQIEPITLEKAKTDYLADAAARKLKDSTIDRHRILLRQLEQFAEKEGLRYLKQFDTPTLRRFRTSWKDGDIAGLKKLERLRTFFKFARESEWIADNPARALKNPKVRMAPTLPFSQPEMSQIAEAATRKIDNVRSDGRNRARLVRVLVLLLRYTGLRFSDAVGCPVGRLKDGKIWLYTQKTGQHVYCPLPEFVAKELEAVPKVSEHYWFWSGNGKLETARKKWSES